MPEKSDQPKSQTAKPAQNGKPVEDLTGRDRLVSSVLFSWGAHFVFIIAGFIMPRMIDRRLGQELLGVWDFAWSLISYFGLVQVGISSSVNRYIARYRTADDIASVNRIVSSASCILGVSGILVCGLAIAASLLLPQLFGARLGQNVRDAQWVVLFLGASMGIEMAFNAFSGVLTGCHRWRLHNIIRSGWHAATVAVMILALLRGGSLPSLAMITFVGVVLAVVTRIVLAHWVCKGLRLRPSLVGWETTREIFLFGGKTLTPQVSRLLLNQTTSILIVVYLGPAALALYSRPWALIHHIETLVNRMAWVLIPTTSSLQSTNSIKGIRELLIKSVRYCFYLVLPMILALVVLGGPILQLWMGPRYANGLVPAILAVGSLTILVQRPVYTILVGLNAHGRAGIAQLIASLCSAGLTVLALGYLGWGIAGAAVAVTLPLTIMNLVYLPFLVCQRLNLDMRRYFQSVTAGPVVHILPFALCLMTCRLLFREAPLTGLVVAMVTGTVVLSLFYWHFVLPKRLKRRICRLFSMRGWLRGRKHYFRKGAYYD